MTDLVHLGQAPLPLPIWFGVQGCTADNADGVNKAGHGRLD
jgi:hypothetical protein